VATWKAASLWREAIEQGSLLGPRLVMAGFLIDGFKWPGNIAATNAEEGRPAVDVLKKTGVDFVKVKSFLPRDAYLAIAAEARRQHIVLAGARTGCGAGRGGLAGRSEEHRARSSLHGGSNSERRDTR